MNTCIDCGEIISRQAVRCRKHANINLSKYWEHFLNKTINWIPASETKKTIIRKVLIVEKTQIKKVRKKTTELKIKNKVKTVCLEKKNIIEDKYLTPTMTNFLHFRSEGIKAVIIRS